MTYPNEEQKNCAHEWAVYEPHVFSYDSCIGAICIKCGLTGCGCDVPENQQKIFLKKRIEKFNKN